MIWVAIAMLTTGLCLGYFETNKSSNNRNQYFVGEYFYIGSTKEQLIKAQGIPTRTDTLGTNKTLYYYGASSVYLKDDLVVSFNDKDKNLNLGFKTDEEN